MLTNKKLSEKFEINDPEYPECASKHLPKWCEKIPYSSMDKKDSDVCILLLDRYNNLTDLENGELKNDAHGLFGIEEEKKEIIDEMVSIYSKYKEQ